MKGSIILLLAMCIIGKCMTLNIPPDPSTTRSAITFILNRGRLGDNLLNYWQTKYLAYVYNLEFLSPAFAYADQLVLGHREKKYAPHMEKTFERVIYLNNDFNQQIQSFGNILYKISFRFKSKYGNGFIDPIFTQSMKESIAPLRPLALAKKVQGRINVALHIRLGSGNDRKKPFIHLQRRFPTKFPPLAFYRDALKKLRELFQGQALHAHVFTDIDRPQKLVGLFQEHFKETEITFSYRHDNTQGDRYHVLTDLFSMAYFDCLIRPMSGLSMAAQFIGNHQVIIFPKTPRWHAQVLSIEELGVIDKRSLVGDFA